MKIMKLVFRLIKGMLNLRTPVPKEWRTDDSIEVIKYSCSCFWHKYGECNSSYDMRRTDALQKENM